MSWGRIIAVGAVVFLLAPLPAMAWGPVTHVKLANDVLAQLHLLPAAVAVILSRYRKDFIFGNIAADVVVAKRLSRVKQLCHHWATGFAILEDARTERSKAFAYGYLAHLAADTVSHNKYLPRQMTLTRTTMSFGHLYWELRADSTLGPDYWRQLRRMLNEVFAEHEACLHARLTDTFLPFLVNWRIFYRMNHLLTRKVWRRVMHRWNNVSRWRLPDHLMEDYRSECVERMIDVLARGSHSAVCHVDPNGNAALAYTRRQRRQLRQMARAGMASMPILREAARGHAPVLNGKSSTPG